MKKTIKYYFEIEGLRGIACLIVLLGHSVACIFPTIYFGNTYVEHSVFEKFIHATPFNLLFNGSAMVMFFFIISGYLMGGKTNHRSVVDFSVERYIRYFPMIIMGIILGAFVMRLGVVYSIKLADYSYAGNYVGLYNNFTPSIIGKNGIIVESFIKVFLVGSNYNSVLWYISVSYIGEIVLTAILNFAKNKKLRIVVMSILTIVFWIVGTKIWQFQYLSGLTIGILIATLKIEINKVKSMMCFVLGIVLLSFEKNSPMGVYLFLQKIPQYIVPIWSVGGGLVMIGIIFNSTLSDIFSNKKLMWFGKYSFSIYAVQWPIIISISCGVCYKLVKYGIDYNFAGWCGILSGIIFTIILAIIVYKWWYVPFYRKLIYIWHNFKEKRIITKE